MSASRRADSMPGSRGGAAHCPKRDAGARGGGGGGAGGAPGVGRAGRGGEQVLLGTLAARDTARDAVIAAWRRALEVRVARATAAAARRCDPDRLARLFRALDRTAESWATRRTHAAQREALEVLDRRRQRAAHDLGSLPSVVDVADPLARTLLHRTRLRVKAWRYAE